MRRLIILRHAKAVRPEAGLGDAERGLEPRGREEAPRAACLIADLVGGVDLALVSAAKRTRETWDAAAPYLPAREVSVEADLYLAGAETWLRRLMACADRETVLAVGHNPGLKDLADVLMGDGPHDVRAEVRLLSGLPTSCAVVVGLDGAPTRGSGRLAAFIAPPRASD